jgi:ABC-type transport system involved in cytochrome bd biosynthesis fused ATPase/permease subunit
LRDQGLIDKYSGFCLRGFIEQRDREKVGLLVVVVVAFEVLILIRQSTNWGHCRQTERLGVRLVQATKQDIYERAFFLDRERQNNQDVGSNSWKARASSFAI